MNNPILNQAIEIVNSFLEMKHKIALSLCIWEFDDISHEEISRILSMVPSKIHVKGEKVNPKFSTLARDNGWMIDADGYEVDDFDKQLNSIIELIESRSEVFKTILNKYYLEISCALFLDGDDSTGPSVHLDKTQQQILSDHGVEIDFDIYITSY